MKASLSLPGLAALSLLLLSSCRSVDRIALERLSALMASPEGSGAFLQDEDPLFVGEALPFALKMQEVLIGMNPDDADLRLAAGRGFIQYANAFLQTPALMLPDDRWEEEELLLRRARNMYLRGEGYVLSGLALRRRGEPWSDDFLARTGREDLPYLYWIAAGRLGALSCRPFDWELTGRAASGVPLLYRCLELDEEWEGGAVHDLLISLWAAVPRGILEKGLAEAPSTAGAFAVRYYREKQVGSEAALRARHHFRRAAALGGENNPSPYLSLASTLSVKEQDYREFETLLNRALAADPAADPRKELMVRILREKAAWYLAHREEFFLRDF